MEFREEMGLQVDWRIDMIDGTVKSMVNGVILRRSMTHKGWRMYKGSNCMFSQAFIDTFIHSFILSICSSNPATSVYSLYVLLKLFQFLGIKQWQKFLPLRSLPFVGGHWIFDPRWVGGRLWHWEAHSFLSIIFSECVGGGASLFFFSFWKK